VPHLVVETNRAITDVAGEYRLNETTVDDVKKCWAAHAADEPALELSERAWRRELECRSRELEMENAFVRDDRFAHQRGCPGHDSAIVSRIALVALTMGTAPSQ
jgi:hypothetical protein